MLTIPLRLVLHLHKASLCLCNPFQCEGSVGLVLSDMPKEARKLDYWTTFATTMATNIKTAKMLHACKRSKCFHENDPFAEKALIWPQDALIPLPKQRLQDGIL